MSKRGFDVDTFVESVVEKKKRGAAPENNFDVDAFINSLPNAKAKAPSQHHGTETDIKGFKGIAADAWGGVKQVPSTVKNVLKELPGEFIGAHKQQFTDPLRMGANLAAGATNFVNGMFNAPKHTIEYLDRKGLPIEYLRGLMGFNPEIARMAANKVYREPNLDVYKQATGLDKPKPGDVFFQSLMEYGPYGMAAELAPFKAGLARAGMRMGAGAAHAIGQNENPVNAALSMGAMEGLGKVAGKAGVKAIELGREMPLTPSGAISKFGGDVPSATLEANLRAAEGTKTPLGRVMEAPTFAKSFENEISPLFGSGSDKIFTEIANDISARGEKLISKLSDNPRGLDSNYVAKNLLEEVYKTSKEVKNNLWNKASETASSEGFNLELPTFKKFIEHNKAAIEEMPLIKNDPEIKSVYKRLSGYAEGAKGTPTKKVISNIVDEHGQPIVSKEIPAKSPSIKETKILAGKLSEEANKLEKSPVAADRSRVGLYRRLASRLRNDVDTSITQKGSDALKSEFKQANDYHAKEFSGFLDKEVFPLLQEGKSGQSIVQEIIKPGKLDKFEQIKKINKLLPENQQELLGYSYLRGAFDKDGQISPSKVTQLVNQLGPRQFEALFKPETRHALSDYKRLVKMNEEALNRMANPMTGARNAQLLQGMKTLVVGLASGLGVGAKTGSVSAALLSGIILPAAQNIAANILTKAATSPKFRQKVVAKKIATQKRREARQAND